MFASPILRQSLRPAFRPNAVETDGSSHIYTLGEGDASTVLLGQMSGFFYVKPTYTGDVQYLFSQIFASGQTLYIYLDKGGQMHFGFTNAATEAYEMQSGEDITFGSWNSVFFALDSTGDNFHACSINGGANAYTYGGAAVSEFGTNIYDVGVGDVAWAVPSGNGLVGGLSQFWLNAYSASGFGEDNYYPQGFYTLAIGYPRNLGELGNATLLDKPTFYFPNDAANYYLNNGQGSPVEFDIWNSFLDVGPPTGYLS